MKSNLQKKVLTVRDKKGTHRQTYYVADAEPNLAKPGHTVPTVTTPRDRASVHYGMLWARTANKNVDHALEAIAKTHDVPSSLFKVNVRVVGSLEGANGVYNFAGLGKNEIHISKYAEHPAATTVHEYGHFLDHRLFGSGQARLGSMGTHDYKNAQVQKELGPLKTAMYSSAAIRQIIKRHDEHVKAKDYTGQQHTQYLLTPSEIFARAYAQWVGTRSSPTVRQQIREQGERWMQPHYNYRAQWEDKDFEPIAREFDRLFAGRGLRKGR